MSKSRVVLKIFLLKKDNEKKKNIYISIRLLHCKFIIIYKYKECHKEDKYQEIKLLVRQLRNWLDRLGR